MHDLRSASHNILLQNTQQATRNGTTYTFSVPSIRSYPFQWFWDSCFHAIVWTHFDGERAKQELYSLVSAQRKDGFIPHIIYWNSRRVHRAPWDNHWQESRGYLSMFPFFSKPITSELMQPPVLAQAVQRVFDASRDTNFLEAMLPKLDAFYRYLAAMRDPDHDHLISVISPYETGMDSSPVYDRSIGFTNGGGMEQYLRIRWVNFKNKVFTNYQPNQLLAQNTFHVEDVLVNAVYGHNLRVLSELHRSVGHNDGAAQWEAAANAVTQALITKCWDEERGAFFNLSGHNEERTTILSLQSLMPLMLSDMPRPYVERLVTQHLLNPKEFWLRYPLASVAANEPSFSANSFAGKSKVHILWRGPSWINTNWFLYHGLRFHGYADAADHLRAQTHALVEREGFHEYYNPLTGRGLGAKNFGWSTLALDMVPLRA